MYIGLDLGGTTISAGLVTANGKVLASSACQLSGLTQTIVVENLAQQARAVCAKAKISLTEVIAVGIGSPGILDENRGIVLNAANFPNWNDVPLAESVSKLLEKPVFLQGDAKCAVAAEAWVGIGAARGVNQFCMLTLGTGIGGGIVMDGKMSKMEPGHVIVEENGDLCGCGQRGCLERYCSATAVARQAGVVLQDPAVKTSLSDLPAAPTCKDVFAAAANGDLVANTITDKCIFHIATACLMLSRVLSPQIIVLSGGMALAGDFLFNAINDKIRELNWNCSQPVPVVPAKCGNQAGFIGAAYSALLGVKNRQTSKL